MTEALQPGLPLAVGSNDGLGVLVPKRATLAGMAARLRDANPSNQPMYLHWMAQQWWPDADWLHARVHNTNGGAKRGPRVAGAFAGRLERAGFLRMCGDEGPRRYIWRETLNV